jgi:dephospho-CoA kinase
MKIGITGGIGSGKTTVCKIFEALGIPIYYADDSAKKLMTSNKVVKSKITSLFGSEAYFRNGRLNRKFISSKVFSDKTLLNKLNAIVHPAVKEDNERWFLEQKSQMALKEAALLIESGSYKDLDKVIVVTCPIETRIERVMSRDKSTKEAVLKRIENQMPEEEKIKYADFIIINDGKKLLIPQVLKIYKKFSYKEH